MAATVYRSLAQLDSPPVLPVWWKVILLVVLPSLVLFVLMDVAWIMLVAAPLFEQVLGTLMRQPPNPVSGLLAWLFIVGGVFMFASRTATNTKAAAVQGLLLGASLYGCYEFTNHSIINSWTWGLALGDLAWGSFACACASATQFTLLKWNAPIIISTWTDHQLGNRSNLQGFLPTEERPKAASLAADSKLYEKPTIAL